MSKAKKDAILFIAESRTTYDFMFSRDQEMENTVELANKIFETKRLLGADVAILSSVTLTSENDFYNDWNWDHVESSWANQCFVEGYKDGKGNFIHEENTFMGKCFYPEGYAELSKEKGFGAWEMIQHEDGRSVTEKITEYIRQLSEEYNITQIFFFYDYGYSDNIIDENTIRSEFQAPINHFIPCKPYCDQNSSLCIFSNGCVASSSSLTTAGVIDCFEQYNGRIEEVLTKMPIQSAGRTRKKTENPNA